MRLNTSLSLCRLVLAFAMLVMATTASAAVDTVSTPGINRFSTGSSSSYGVWSAVVGYEPLRSYHGEYSNWKALIQFSIPQGSYTAATLSFSTSPYQLWPNVADPSGPSIKVGLFDLLEVPFPFDYSKNIIALSTGASYASVDMAWPSSYTVSVSPSAITEINSAAGALFSVVFAPLEVCRPAGMGPASFREHRKRCSPAHASGA